MSFSSAVGDLLLLPVHRFVHDRVDPFYIRNPKELGAALLSAESWAIRTVPVRWLIPEINRAATIPAFFERQRTERG